MKNFHQRLENLGLRARDGDAAAFGGAADSPDAGAVWRKVDARLSGGGAGAASVLPLPWLAGLGAAAAVAALFVCLAAADAWSNLHDPLERLAAFAALG